jgi:uncharacterized protein
MSLFDLDRCAMIGMVHLLPLPGSSSWGGSMNPILERARRDADALAEGGCDAIIVENMGDVPYLRGTVHPETVAAMARATAEVVQRGLPTGVQLLSAANREALGVAVAAGASFVRAEAFAYAHVADEGWLDASAGPLLRARAALGSGVAIWADVKKKHASHAVTADLSLLEAARGAAFFGADALIVTGVATGRSTALDDVIEMKKAGLPVVVGSGVTPKDALALSDHADALIVGSWIKEDGDWRNPVALHRVVRLRCILDGDPA